MEPVARSRSCSAPDEWARCRGGPGPARAPARRAARRPLRPAARCCTEGCCRPSWCSGTPASCAPATGDGRRAGAGCTSTPPTWCARADGAFAGAGRSHPGAVGRRLRAREPHRRLARAARGVPRLPRRSGWRRSSAPCANAGAPGAPQPRQPARRAADARARTTRPTSSTPSWRSTSATRWSRRRPDGARRARLPEDAGRPAARRRDPAPGRTTTTATRWSCGPIAARRPGPGAGGARGQRGGRQPAGQRRWSQTPALLPYLPRSVAHLLGEELRAALGRDLVVRRRGGAGARRSSASTTLVVKPAFTVGHAQPIFAAQLDAAERARRCARAIAADPAA